MSEAENLTYVHAFIDGLRESMRADRDVFVAGEDVEVRDLGALLQRAGFAMPVADTDVLAHLGQIYAADTSRWELVRRDDIPYALPEQPAPFTNRSALEVETGLILAGDHVDTGSVQGAMVSGRRAADGWLARTGAGPQTA